MWSPLIYLSETSRSQSETSRSQFPDTELMENDNKTQQLEYD